MRNNNVLLDPNGTTHAPGCDGNGYVLCGDSIDGEDGAGFMTWARLPIDCGRCVNVIYAAKAIAVSRIAKTHRRTKVRAS